MAFVSATNTLMLAMRGTLHTFPYVNTLYFKKFGIGAITEADVDDLNGRVANWWSTEIAPHLGASIALSSFYYTDLSTQTSPVYERFVTLVGLKPGNVMPGSVALSVTFNTAGRGRSSRGRNYVGGLVENDVNGNNIVTSVATGIRDGYGNMDAYLQGGGFNWVVVSRYTNKAPRLSALVQNITSVGIANVQVDSQRRRVKQV